MLIQLILNVRKDSIGKLGLVYAFPILQIKMIKQTIKIILIQMFQQLDAKTEKLLQLAMVKQLK